MLFKIIAFIAAACPVHPVPAVDFLSAADPVGCTDEGAQEGRRLRRFDLSGARRMCLGLGPRQSDLGLVEVILTAAVSLCSPWCQRGQCPELISRSLLASAAFV